MKAPTLSLKHPAVRMGFSLLFLLTAAHVVGAGGDKSAAPSEPLLPRAPDMSAWTITYVYPSDKAQDSTPEKADEKAAPDKAHHRGKKTPSPQSPQSSQTPKYRITSVKFEKTGNIYHKTTYWDTGKQTQAWSIGGREVIKDQDDLQYVPTPANGPLADNFSDSDFEDLAWINMKFYAGLEHGSHTGFIFTAKRKDRGMTRRETIAYQVIKQLHPSSNNRKSQTATNSPANEADDEDSNEEDTVVLDSTNQLPVEYDQGSVKWTYQFTSAPEAHLTPPQEVSTLMEHWDDYNKASEPAISRP